MTIFFLFSTSKKVRGPGRKKSAFRTGSGRGKGPNSNSDRPDLRGLIQSLNHKWLSDLPMKEKVP